MIYTLFSIVLFLVLIKKKILLSNLIEDRWSDKRVSMSGGIVFFIVTAFFILFNHEFKNQFYIIFFFSTLIFLLGFIDDVFTLDAKDKFLWQLLITYCFIRVLLHGSLVDSKWLLFVLFSLGIVNSINMIDNMNGICGLTILPILFSFTLIIPEFKHFFMLLIWILIVFLIFNLKGKVFMGDSGSHFLGLILAGFACYYLTNHFDIRSIIGVVFLFGASFIDTGYVVARRTLNKKAFWIGDKNHLSHEIARIADDKISLPNFIFFLASLTFNMIGVQIVL